MEQFPSNWSDQAARFIRPLEVECRQLKDLSVLLSTLRCQHFGGDGPLKTPETRLKKLINGNNKSYQIISDLAAECGRMETTIGAEIQFILRRLNGEKIFCSSEILRHEYLNRMMFKLGIEI